MQVWQMKIQAWKRALRRCMPLVYLHDEWWLLLQQISIWNHIQYTTHTQLGTWEQSSSLCNLKNLQMPYYQEKPVLFNWAWNSWKRFGIEKPMCGAYTPTHRKLVIITHECKSKVVLTKWSSQRHENANWSWLND